MLKDYFNPSFSPKNNARIRKSLDQFPSWTVFPSYGQARSYRAANDYKGENGRYSFSIVLYDGFYYLMNKDQLHRFKLFLHAVARDDSMDKGIAKINAELDAQLAALKNKE
jgi:hypothetical protein